MSAPFDDEAPATQQYHVYHNATGGNNRIDNVDYDANAVQANVYIDAASRSVGDSLTPDGVQNVAYAANVTMDPWKGTTVVVGQLTGNVVIDDSSATKHSDGLRLDVIFATDATPRTITAGTRFTITGSPLTVAASKVRTLSFVYSKAGAWVMTNDSGDV